MSHNGDYAFEPPWSSYEFIPENPVISVAVNHLEQLLLHREKLSCPKDERDIKMLSAIRRVINSTRYLMEQDLSDTRKLIIIRKSRLLIKEANSYIEKTLKIRSN